MIQRVTLALVALFAAGWFAVDWHDARSLNHAQAAVSNPKASRAQLEAALHDVHSARTLNPDRNTPLSVAVTLDVRLGRYGPALAGIERLVRIEPQNVEAWAFLSALSEPRDPALAARALRRVKQLDPGFQTPRP